MTSSRHVPQTVLVLVALPFLRGAGRGFCRPFLCWDLPVSLTIHLSLWMEDHGGQVPSHPVTSGPVLSPWLICIAVTLVTCLRCLPGVSILHHAGVGCDPAHETWGSCT